MIRTKIVLCACAFALVVASFVVCDATFESAQTKTSLFARVCIALFGTVIVSLVLFALERFVRKAIEQGAAIPPPPPPL